VSNVHKALIIGGGIGGLTAAVALRRSGIDVDLVEIKPDNSVYGVGIIQPNNTLRALHRVGLADECVRRGGPYPGWRIFDESNKLLLEAPASNRAAPDHPPINGITRPILHQILTRAAESAGAHIRYGTTVADYRALASDGPVTFTCGSKSEYDLVVAADGVYSATRRALFGAELQPRLNGQSVWRYNLPRPPDMTWGEVYYGSGVKVGLVPLSPVLMYMFLVTAEPGNPRYPVDQLAELMRDRLADFTGRVGGLRELIVDPAAVVYKPMETLLMPGPWHSGRCIIIGDAVHATTPHLAQGAAMAIEDAVLLAELCSGRASLTESFQEFMQRRFRRAKFVVDSSDQIAAWELEEWNGVINPDARPGELLYEATMTLLDEY
jgi:2-polyprenyl-6-methoxyphenol hydroxylase-like FAD-dependent oxidoreductase